MTYRRRTGYRTFEIPMDPELRRKVALHEAGHAIAGQLLGIPVEKITVKNGGGACYFHVPAWKHATAERKLPVLAAGDIAEFLFYRRITADERHENQELHYIVRGLTSDNSRIKELRGDIGQARREALELLEPYCKQIYTIAERILKTKRGTITGRNLVTNMRKNRKWRKP